MRRFSPFAAVCFLPLAASLANAAADAEGIEFFEQKIRPVLVGKCYKCHSAEAKEVKGGFLLDTRQGIQKGGESGHGVVPGNLEQSLIIEAIKHESFEMPPDEQLPETVIRDFEKWVKMGAPDPRDGKGGLIKRKINFEEARQFWAFQPITQPDVPEVQDTDWPAGDIDRFVLAKLEEHGLHPVGDADANLLIRRVYFDLTGLPPSLEDVEAFVADPSPDAYEALLDRLFDSPQFGERWGRHWMDVVRFAESTGMERNFTYPHAWRYRDYVIESFNEDKPFDRFIREQIAGDLLTPGHPRDHVEYHVATGLLALGPKSLNETNREQFAMDIVDEQIDVVSRAFLGLTVSCARCHDHKFDPIPQREYYALAGIFRSTDTYYGTLKQNGNRHPGDLLAVTGRTVKGVEVRNGKSDKSDASPDRLKRQLKTAERKLKQLRERKNQNNGTRKQIAQTGRQIKRLKDQLHESEGPGDEPADDATLVMGVLDAKNIADTELRVRGEPNDRGERVPRGFLTIATLGDASPIPDDHSGRRQFADWLLNESNPLTARVAVNRIWQHLFGRGIVASVNNFGANGERPTHPELLDHLAVRLPENGWSFKETIREIMLSRAYRASTTDDPHGLDVDPDNHLLWRMNQRRLEVEAIRDAMLAANGRLDLTPMQTSVVATIGDGNVGRNLRQDSFATESFKRSVYLPIVRGAVPEMLRIFDFPEPSIISGQRDVTTVPTQALFMMNSNFVVDQSEHLARRILAEASDDTQRIDVAYMLTLSRHPSAAEVDVSLDFIEQANEMTPADMPEKEKRLTGWTGFCQALLASAEFRYLD